jgi:riboflavin kinase/FMN adenylyltransferase
MKIYRTGERIPFKTSVAIGMFDGVHRGHKMLIKKTIDVAKSYNLTPMVYTFSNHPIKESSRKYLTLLNERLEIMECSGISVVYIAELNEDFMKMSPDVFLKTEICEKVNAKSVIVGENFQFGKDRRGNVAFMERVLNSYGIDTFPVKLAYYNGKPISSSLIYNLVVDGNIKEADALLGYAFFLSGKIVRGKGVGRLLGFPTANLRYFNGYKVIPKRGVYVTVAAVGDMLFKSVTNVGLNPTFEDTQEIKVETHFIDEQINLYGKTVRLHFFKRLRGEKKFPSVSILMGQIQKDVSAAKDFFMKKGNVGTL